MDKYTDILAALAERYAKRMTYLTLCMMVCLVAVCFSTLAKRHY